MTPQALANWATVIGAGVAALALGFTAYQVRLNTKALRAQFLLMVQEMFEPYEEVHRKLRPGGEWSSYSAQNEPPGPRTAEDWQKLEAYMGLFEHCKIVILDNDLITKPTFKQMFAYRLRNIVHNPMIVEAKLSHRAPTWEVFIQLLEDRDIEIPRRRPEQE
jgi:hypothetical protein